ncbi:MAG: guanylate kinase [Candidatus Omnitrophica bacterium]|nr:guanylate kinase [Candidatus Omnitrophota bacterium]
MLNRSLFFVISGPSGSGKTTLIKKLLRDKSLKGKICRSISFTTRAKRKGEKDKRDYFFISEEEFKRKLKGKKILEWTKILNYYYGTSLVYFQNLLKKRCHIIFCLDDKGASRIKRLYPDRTVTIFILAPGLTTLKIRMHKREKGLDKKQLFSRLQLAKAQLKKAKFYDYQLINDNIDQAFKNLKEIIIKEITLHNHGRRTLRTTSR